MRFSSFGSTGGYFNLLSAVFACPDFQTLGSILYISYVNVLLSSQLLHRIWYAESQFPVAGPSRSTMNTHTSRLNRYSPYRGGVSQSTTAKKQRIPVGEFCGYCASEIESEEPYISLKCNDKHYIHVECYNSFMICIQKNDNLSEDDSDYEDMSESQKCPLCREPITFVNAPLHFNSIFFFFSYFSLFQ